MSLPSTFAVVAQRIDLVIRCIGRVTLLVVLLWTATLWWGERTVFERSVAACEWWRWEAWPAGANPHHVLFVADPQLVDPHTYPGRPWPLSTLTVLYTDLYMRRTYRYLLDRTQPHSTVFLGDLFDGGREWAAADYESPEDRYKRYGTDFWLREYCRFMNMFVSGWYENNWHGYLTGEGRRIIASLPGNHDLGFAGGINEHVRNRFEAHFGPSNRVDILGNHTFVSLDTVSLSAMDQVDPATGSSGAGDGTGQDTKHMEIWKPVEGFLLSVRSRRSKAVQRRYQHFKSLSKVETLPTDDISTRASKRSKEHREETSIASSNFPTVVLSHVPLYRNQDVTCGPLRERGDAIPLSAGYQYQNVLTPAVSKDIIDHLDADQIAMIYSGDDHDYCEIEHGEFNGRVKEITVKSMSWAMGVRKPGVQLASLWNPIDMEAIARGEASSSTPRDTVQNHLCLLPDQLSIFIRYGQILGLTILILLIRTILYKPQQTHLHLSQSPTEKDKSQPLLPLTRKLTPPSSPNLSPTHYQSTPHNTSTPTHIARSRSNGKSSYGNLPASSRSASPSPPIPGDTDDWGMPKTPLNLTRTRSQSYSTAFQSSYDRRTAASTTIERLAYGLFFPAPTKASEFLRSLYLVAAPVLLFYFWLLWHG